MKPKRLILAVTGASGTIYALALARALRGMDGIETHLVVSDAAKEVMRRERPDISLSELTDGMAAVHDDRDIGAPPASGSWRCAGMVVCPCSMATLAGVAGGLANSLILRAADVTLKERRRLVLVTRETPLHRIHLTNMLAATDAGAMIFPASPGFYHGPKTIDDLAAQLAGRILDQFDIEHQLFARWGG